ncbi:MAG: hypothetical protein Q4G26_16015 [Paracoccus sp. (in: a-proteobacteria)]|nr:hypothetical protein [Paracoccus sp. (in: a-proteobacteria)]
MTLQERIDQFAAWFDIEPLKLDCDDPDSDVVLDWCLAVHASIDWIICGDPKVMAASYRQKLQNEQRFADSTKEMSATELQAMLFAMRAVADGKATAEQAFPMMAAEITRLRTQ